MLLNLDAGELDSETEALWSLFDVLSCACGGHVGDDRSMARVAAFVRSNQSLALGAHPSYPDRDGFGRRSIAIAPAALTTSIADQCRALAHVADDVPIRYVKPHGALYHDAARDPAIATAVIEGAVAALGERITIIGPPAGALLDAALARRLGYAREGFADRRLRDDGSLVPRTEPNALIEDPRDAAAQATRLAAQVDTICVHADTPHAIEIARAVRGVLG